MPTLGDCDCSLWRVCAQESTKPTWPSPRRVALNASGHTSQVNRGTESTRELVGDELSAQCQDLDGQGRWRCGQVGGGSGGQDPSTCSWLRYGD